MTDKELNELCLEWQKTLRLQDWNVHTEIRRGRDMVNKDAEGECNWTLSLKEAHIHIIDPVDYTSEADYKQDIEEILVHELLHLHFAEWTSDGDGGIPVSGEQGVECIAQAFMRVKRQTISPTPQDEVPAPEYTD